VSSAIAKPLTLVAMSLGFALVQLDVIIVNVALTSIAQSFGASTENLQWVVNAYTITFAALILSAGSLGDRFGAKRVFSAGFAIFVVASVACAVSPNVYAVIAARALQGIGAAALVPNSLALLNHAYSDTTERSRAVTAWASGGSIALTIGPLVGGSLIAVGSWKSAFLVNLPIGVIGLVLTLRFARETPLTDKRSIDFAGQWAAVLMLGLLAAAVIKGGALGWSDPWILAGLCVAGVASAIFVLIERRVEHPMLPLYLFARRTFWVTSVTGLMVNAAFYGLIFVLSLYFQQVNHLTAFHSGLALVPMTAAVLIGNLVAGRFVRRLGARRTIALGQAMIAAGCLALWRIRPGLPVSALCSQMMLMGFGLGLLVPPLISALLGSVEKSNSGIASGVLNSMRQCGSLLGVSLFGSFVANQAAFIGGFKLALIASASLAMLACILVLFGIPPMERKK
jgi:DHA2 family methylenomycin A resistance protein-like MFS transporter